jgi:hypothetical protein
MRRRQSHADNRRIAVYALLVLAALLAADAVGVLLSS